MSKTVYVLGAGFSIPAGAPSQAAILSRIGDHAEGARLRRFAEDVLGLAAEEFAGAALEDLYTPIDRCLADGTSMKGHSGSDLAAIRAALDALVVEAITSAIDESSASRAYIDDFARYAVRVASYRSELAQAGRPDASKAYDPLAIISLNWDTLLDNAIHAALLEHDPRQGDYDPFGVVDYCCYISSVERGDARVRSGLFTLGCKGFNVKVLKLHGSMNWFQCPNCQRLFVKFGENDYSHLVGRKCRHCLHKGWKHGLRGSMVMPTFLKDLTNFQVKLVWQNAGVELMEADNIVFVGYSFPHADFEFRQLLSRMVRRKTKIDVILHASDRKRRTIDRFTQFFGAARVSADFGGVEKFVKRLSRP